MEDLICEELESVTVQIKNGKFKPFFITSIYRLPGKLLSYFSELASLFGMLESQNKESIIMGDINCDLNIPLDHNTTHSNNFLNSSVYSQLIKSATRTNETTSTLMDHIITDRPDVISSSAVRPCGISDHDALFLSEIQGHQS